MARKTVVAGSRFHALPRSRFSGAVGWSSTLSSSRATIWSRAAAAAMLGGMRKRTSMGVPLAAERTRDRRRGPAPASAAAGLAASPAAGAAALAGAGDASLGTTPSRMADCR